MTVKELRIGNYIQFSEGADLAKVIEVTPRGVGVAIGDEETWIEIEQFEGLLLTEENIKKLRRVVRPDFKPIEFSMTPPGERQITNNWWSNEINDDRILHLSPSYKTMSIQTYPEFWYAWICAHGTGSSWFLSLRSYRKNPLKYVHQLQNLFFELTGEELCLS